MQARELTETLTALDAAGVEGAFVHEFATAGATFSEEPRYDLDMNAFALVKTYRHGKGTTYPDMNWDPILPRRRQLLRRTLSRGDPPPLERGPHSITARAYARARRTVIACAVTDARCPRQFGFPRC